MRKYVWFLVAAAFAVAIFAMVGCKPAGTPETSPSVTTSPAPTPDTKCPQITSIVVKNVYGDMYRKSGDTDGGTTKLGGYFTITLTFDEDIAGKWSCITDENSWTVTVSNGSRKDTEGEAEVVNVEKVDANEIKITAWIGEDSGGLDDDVTGSTYYLGLVCDDEDAGFYGEVFGEDYTPTVADTVKVELDNDCIVYDALGNACCGLEA